MTQAKFVRFTDEAEANHILGGGIVGGKFNGRLAGLVGNTLTFTTPAGSVTFTQDSGAPVGFMRFEAFKTQVETAITNLKVLLINDNVAFKHATAGTAVVMGNNDEPAKNPLGFKNATTISGTAYNGPGGAAPKVVDFTVESNRIFVMLEV